MSITIDTNRADEIIETHRHRPLTEEEIELLYDYACEKMERDDLALSDARAALREAESKLEAVWEAITDADDALSEINRQYSNVADIVKEAHEALAES